MRRLSVLLSVVLAVLGLAPAASAEWFADADTHHVILGLSYRF